MSEIAREIRQHTHLEEVRPNRLLGKCPFHTERTPSLLVDEEQNRWHCLGCGLGGDVDSFRKLVEAGTVKVGGR